MSVGLSPPNCWLNNVSGLANVAAAPAHTDALLLLTFMNPQITTLTLFWTPTSGGRLAEQAEVMPRRYVTATADKAVISSLSGLQVSRKCGSQVWTRVCVLTNTETKEGEVVVEAFVDGEDESHMGSRSESWENKWSGVKQIAATWSSSAL